MSLSDEAARSNVWEDHQFKGWAKGKGVTFVDDDLLGFMTAKAAKEDGSDDGKGSVNVRRAVLEVTRAVSLTPWAGDVTFNAASPGATPSASKGDKNKSKNPVPYGTKRVRDRDVLHVLWQMLKATGKRGVPQGGVISPLLSNLYLTEVDQMLERAKRVTRDGSTSAVEYARYADDLVVLVHEGRRWDWVLRAVHRRLREEFGKLRVEVNEEKSRVVDLRNGESFGFLGFDFRRVRSRWGRWRPLYTPQRTKRTALLRTLRENGGAKIDHSAAV